MPELTAARQGPSIAPSARVHTLPPAARWVLRGDTTVMAAATRALDLPFADTACRAVAEKGIAALWLGPDERLLIAPADAQSECGSRVAAAVSGHPHSLVEVSHRQVALQIDGAQAAVLLNSGCPLDLHLSAFPPGMCTRTVFAKADIVLWRTEAHRFHLEVWRSFAAYVSQYLALAAAELES